MSVSLSVICISVRVFKLHYSVILYQISLGDVLIWPDYLLYYCKMTSFWRFYHQCQWKEWFCTFPSVHWHWYTEGSARTLTGVVYCVVFYVSVFFTDTDTDEIKRCGTHFNMKNLVKLFLLHFNSILTIAGLDERMTWEGSQLGERGQGTNGR